MVRLFIRSEPWNRVIITNRAKPRLASHAPRVSNKILAIPTGRPDIVSITGTYKTNLNIRPSSVIKAIRR